MHFTAQVFCNSHNLQTAVTHLTIFGSTYDYGEGANIGQLFSECKIGNVQHIGIHGIRTFQLYTLGKTDSYNESSFSTSNGGVHVLPLGVVGSHLNKLNISPD